VFGIFSSEAAIRHLVGATLLKQNEERTVQRRRSLTLESMAGSRDDPLVKRPSVAD
jgi:hypothetical protein